MDEDGEPALPSNGSNIPPSRVGPAALHPAARRRGRTPSPSNSEVYPITDDGEVWSETSSEKRHDDDGEDDDTTSLRNATPLPPNQNDEESCSAIPSTSAVHLEDAVAEIRLDAICTATAPEHFSNEEREKEIRAVRRDIQFAIRDAFEEACDIVDVQLMDEPNIQAQECKELKHIKWHAVIKIRSSAWDTSLAALAFHFLRLIKDHPDWVFATSDMPTLTASSRLFFPLRCITGTMENKLRSLSFCSLLDPGSVAVHWQITDNGQRNEEILVDVLYDRRLFECHYHNVEQVKEDDIWTNAKMKYKVKMNMEFVRRIIVDQNPKTKKDGGENTFMLWILLIELRHQLFTWRASSTTIVLFQLFDSASTLLSRPLPSSPAPNSRPDTLCIPLNVAPLQEASFEKGHCDRTCGRGRGGYGRGRGRGRGGYGRDVYITQLGRGRHSRDSSGMDINECTAICFEFDEHESMYEIMSRLRHVTNRAIEFASLDQRDMISGRVWDDWREEVVQACPYEVTPQSCFDWEVKDILREPWIRKEDERGVRFRSEHIDVKIWRIQILLEGILQRGFECKNQLLVSRSKWLEFVRIVARMYANEKVKRADGDHEQKALATMDRLLNAVCDPRQNIDIFALLERERKDTFASPHIRLFDRQMQEEGYTRVHRILFTPSRMLYKGVDTIMSNRVLRKYNKNGTEVVRVAFRDENGDLMRRQATGENVITNMFLSPISGLLRCGFFLGGRHYKYLGSSNSQLRDHGAYFVHVVDKHDKDKKIRKIRQELGKFEELGSVPKFLARLGQCFTQARSLEDTHESTLKAAEVRRRGDYVGGRKMEFDSYGKIREGEKPYCFSDGVGQISKEKADQLAEANGFYPTPSAFQIRHEGEKGLVTVNPDLDEQNVVRRKVIKRTREGGWGFLPDTHFVSRPSMEKFSTHDEDVDTVVELVKQAQPTALSLNKPLINIMDQVSSLQSLASNHRVCARIEELLRLQLAAGFKALIDEKEAREMLQEHVNGPLHVSEMDGIQVTTEPHLRSLLLAIVRFMLQKQLRKMQIRLSPSMGRSVFGAVDDTGILQSGQVFIQVSKNIGKKHAKRREAVGPASSRIHTGPVLISKMPCVVAGDVRMFDAIDVPSLRHLVDVLVFPRHGPRPHADEMAGSDLDGDEYSVIFDPELFFEGNEEAMFFPSADPEGLWPLVPRTLDQDLAKFYTENLTTEAVGVYANAHLALSDAQGIEHPVCMDIARKLCEALDFQKSGKKPKDLRTSEDFDPKRNPSYLPAEKPPRKPEFMQKFRDPSYKSKGVMGRIYVEVERHISALTMAEHQIKDIPVDPHIDCPGWGRYKQDALKAYESYNAELKSLMETYGIESEAEVISGAIINIKYRISEKEADDLCIYNTNQVISEKLSLIQRAHREDFFRPFCKWEDELSHFGTERLHVVKKADILEMRCDHPSEPMMQKAVAYYRVAYEASNRAIRMGDDERVLLSFPWLVYDVIAHVRRQNLKKSLEEGEKEQADNEAKYNNRPLAIELSKLPAKYSNDESQRVAFAEFKRKNSTGDGVLAQLMREYQNLAEHVFVLVEWARRAGVFEKPRSIGEEHMVALVVCFALGKYNRYTTNFIYPPTGESREILNGGSLILEFLQWIGGRTFKSRSELGFFDVHPSVFSRGQWTSLHEAAVVSFLHLVVSHSLDLPLPGETTAAERAAAVRREMTPFVAELPADVIACPVLLGQVTSIVKRLSGVEEAAIKKFGHTERVMVSAVGAFQAFEKLRLIMTIEAPSREVLNDRDKAFDVPRLLYDRILMEGGELPAEPTETATYSVRRR